MQELLSTIPDSDTLIALSPEELAQHLILAVKRVPDRKAHPSQISANIFERSCDDAAFPQSTRQFVIEAIFEAWAWLRGQGLLVPTDGASGEWCRLSRRACTLADPSAFAEYRKSRLLPKELVHEDIRERVWLNVMRGDFETAVFEAMRRVEINVRAASKLNGVGVALMRSAFHPETGPLTDAKAEYAEREARMHLFSGAIGSYKNPVSHRHVPLDDAGEVVEQIMLASHLLRIIDARKAFNLG